MPKNIVALALLTREELDSLGPAFSRAFPLERTSCFGDLLTAIDEADRQVAQKGEARLEQPAMFVHPTLPLADGTD